MLSLSRSFACFFLSAQHGLLYTLPMSNNRSMKLHSIYSTLHILLKEHIHREGKISQV